VTDRLGDNFDYVGAYERARGLDADEASDNEEERARRKDESEALRLSRLAAQVDRTKGFEEWYAEWPVTKQVETDQR
jgi:hypothetical protein